MRMKLSVHIFVALMIAVQLMTLSVSASIFGTLEEPETILSDHIENFDSNHFSKPLHFRGDPPDLLWNTTFGTDEHREKAQDVKQTTDGGFILAGYTFSYAPSADAWLIKTDSEGNVLWDKTYGGNGTDVAYAVVQTTDDGFVFTGESTSTDFYGDGFVTKTDSSGQMLWTLSFGVNGTEDFGYDILESSDNTYIVVGTTNISLHGDNFSSNAIMLKIDQQGTLLWQKTYGGPTVDAGFSVDETNDQGYAITGYTYSYASGENYVDTWLVKTDQNGVEQWNLSIGTAEKAQIGNDVIQINDGRYALTGYSNLGGVSDALLILTDGDQNTQIYSYNRSIIDRGWEIDQTDDEGFIISGTTVNWHESDSGCIPGWNHIDVWLFKTDINGNLEWDMYYGDEYADTAYAVQQTIDGGFITAGYYTKKIDDYHVTQDAWLLKFGIKEEPEVAITHIEEGIGKLKVAFKNIGSVFVDEPSWIISVQGGLLSKINLNEQGGVNGLSVGETVSTETEERLFGLGKIDIEITATYAEPWNAQAFILGPFIHIEYLEL